MTETRTLLLTDVVDSTKLSEAIGDRAMAEVWAAHDRAARDLLPQWRGREIDKTDGMLLMFDTPADAVNYALQYHRALASMPMPLKARAGLHVGPVILRENQAADVARGAKPLEVDGLVKPTAARVMSLARGGQTLLTPEAREALGETDLPMLSHGHWMIKGVSTPVELFEVGADAAQFAAPPDSDKVYRVVEIGGRWLPVKEIPNNLPQQGTSFIGREREIDEVKAMLGGTPLVTLLGMGGLGKTRLSLQVADEQMALFPDGVWFLDLSPLRDAALVVAETARVLDVPEEPGRPLLQALCSHLKSKRMLLILDNCEHLIKPSADMAHAIVKAAPNVRMIASSREALHVPGEKAYPILPLQVPDLAASLQVLQGSAAVQLFVQRAQAHKPSFELNEREAPAVAALVARLEGIPLALELAAARVRSLSVADINTRLKDRYKILTGGSRVLQERQQTLRALVDWSYELLNENEQLMLRRLAVFIGGFDLEAAEKVCGVEPIEDFEVIDLLGSLVEKSLASLEERDHGSRYRMLETIRDYANEKLQQDAEGAAAVSVKHCEYFFQLAKDANRGLDGPEQGAWLRRIEGELDNIRSAIQLALAGGVEQVIAMKLCNAMTGFWTLRGHATEGRALVKATLALPAIATSDFARSSALYIGACLAIVQGDHAEARGMLESCLELRRRLGNPEEVAATLSALAVVRLQEGDAAAAGAGEREALEIFRQLGDHIGELLGLLHLGEIAHFLGDYEQAAAQVQRAMQIAREVEHQELQGACELVLGKCAFEGEDHAAAKASFERALEAATLAGDNQGEAEAHRWLGKVDLLVGSSGAARGHLGDALRQFRASEKWHELLGCLEDHAQLLHSEGATSQAVCIAAFATTTRERLDLGRAPRDDQRWQLQLQRLRNSMAEETFAADWNRGRDQWNIADAVLCSLSVAATGALNDLNS